MKNPLILIFVSSFLLLSGCQKNGQEQGGGLGETAAAASVPLTDGSITKLQHDVRKIGRIELGKAIPAGLDAKVSSPWSVEISERGLELEVEHKEGVVSRIGIFCSKNKSLDVDGVNCATEQKDFSIANPTLSRTCGVVGARYWKSKTVEFNFGSTTLRSVNYYNDSSEYESSVKETEIYSWGDKKDCETITARMSLGYMWFPGTPLERVLRIYKSTLSDFQAFKDDGGLENNSVWNKLEVLEVNTSYNEAGFLKGFVIQVQRSFKHDVVPSMNYLKNELRGGCGYEWESVQVSSLDGYRSTGDMVTCLIHPNIGGGATVSVRVKKEE